MRLSSAELSEGRQFVYRRDLSGLVRWARSLQIVTLDLDELEQTFAREFQKTDLAKAQKIFQDYFATVDRDEEFRAWRFGIIQWAIYSLAFGVGMVWMLIRAKGG